MMRHDEGRASGTQRRSEDHQGHAPTAGGGSGSHSAGAGLAGGSGAARESRISADGCSAGAGAVTGGWCIIAK